MSALLRFHLHKGLRDFRLDLSLHVDREVHVLVGPSGCGKSTLLRLLAGLLRPDEGRIDLDGRCLLDTATGVDVPPEDRAVGYLVQTYALFPHLSVSRNVAYGLPRVPDRERDRRVGEALQLVGVRHLASAMPGGLSGGEQQRVALARAVAREPDFLLLDEPLSALDVSTRAGVRAELATILHRLSIPTIVVSHDYEDARVLGDCITVIDRGRMVQTGAAEEVARRPTNAFVAAFTGTNLVPVQSGWQAAFDPWHVQLSSRSTGMAHEWPAHVSETVRMGPFDRLRLDLDEGGCLAADVLVDGRDHMTFDVGEEVHAGVASEHVRFVEASPSPADEHVPLDGEADDPPALALGSRWPARRWAAGLAAVFAAILAMAYVAASGPGGGGAEPISAEGGGGALTALVAANMTDAFDALLEEYEAQEGGAVQPSYAGTQVLFTQLSQGAPADLFISADLEYAKRAKAEDLIDSFRPVAHMDLVVVVPDGNPAGVSSLADLADADVDVVIGVDNVPIGKYTREVLRNAEDAYGADFAERVRDNIVSMETNTKQVAQKAVTGAADAAVVYRTDVTPAVAKDVEVIEVPPAYNEAGTNYAAVLNEAQHPERARRLIDYMASPPGQEIVQEFGYDSIE